MSADFDPWAVLAKSRRERAEDPSPPISSAISRPWREPANRIPEQNHALNPQISRLAGLAGVPSDTHGVSGISTKKERKEISLSLKGLTANKMHAAGPISGAENEHECTAANPANLLNQELSSGNESENAEIASANRRGGSLLIGGGPGSPAVEAWHRGLSSLSPGVIPCPDYRPDEWSTVLANARDFLDRFGAQAEALGWRSHELFGAHPTHGTIRVDHCGALILVVCGPVRAITADLIRFDRVTYRRRPHAPVGVLIWEFAR